MQIFAVDSDPYLSAQMLCDKHVVKQILESNQLLCAEFWQQGISAPYRQTHVNHPCRKWIHESQDNFDWLIHHGFSLCREYTYRYKKIHKSQAILQWCLENSHRLNFDSADLTDFAIAISPDKACRSVGGFDLLKSTTKYKLYYKLDKPFAKWQYSERPYWMDMEVEEIVEIFG